MCMEHKLSKYNIIEFCHQLILKYKTFMGFFFISVVRKRGEKVITRATLFINRYIYNLGKGFFFFLYKILNNLINYVKCVFSF